MPDHPTHPDIETHAPEENRGEPHALLRAAREKSAYLLTFEKRLERTKKLEAALDGRWAMAPEIENELKARWMESIAALASCPSRDPQTLARKVSVFERISATQYPLQPAQLFLLGLVALVMSDAKVLGVPLSVECQTGPPEPPKSH
jgi:hypothetical protein